MDKKILLYAPNIHVGGGVVLLQNILTAWPDDMPLRAILDVRAQSRLTLPPHVEVLQWVSPTLVSRWSAERKLHGASMPSDCVLCFHGLPPLLPNAGRVVVFLQNRLFFGLTRLSMFRFKTALRLRVECQISRHFRFRVSEFIVQTPTMARDLVSWHTNGDCHAPMPQVRVLPFSGRVGECASFTNIPPTEWDFVYVADGEAHKNHYVLLQAWVSLAQLGIKPRLALTLGSRDALLAKTVDKIRSDSGAQVYNLGQMSHEHVIALYQRSRALIFPSLSESFGLPLLEAKELGLPILAPELDYVRDVCDPVQTFDPLSAISVARAVRRFLDQPEPALDIISAEAFWDVI